MKNRKFLYGYLLQDGKMVIHPQEAVTVRNIIALYLEGVSYQKIADTLNSAQTPYSEDAPLWNKHKVKRLLENPRYAGANGYPAEIEQAVYEAVQLQIRSKTSGQTPKEVRPALWLKPYLRCGHCNGNLCRICGREASKDTIHLRCEVCGERITVRDEDLIAQVTAQTLSHTLVPEEAYCPSDEVIRLTNAVDRGLEEPDSPEKIIALILQGVSARYDCCPAPEVETPPRCLTEDILKRLRETASYITLSKENVITVHFLTAMQKEGKFHGTDR